MVEWVQQIWPSKQDSVETVFLSTGSPEQLELFRYNSKKVFDVYISKVYPVVQDEMGFTFYTHIKGVLVHFNSSVFMIRKRSGRCY